MADDDISDVLSECSDISYFSDYDLDLEQESQSINFDLSNGSPVDSKNFNVVHFNIDSILAEGRLEQSTKMCRILPISVLVITETKLDQTIPNNLIMINGYHEPVRRDRLVNGRNGGGVLVYVADYLIFEQKVQFQADNFEHVWVDVKVREKWITINALYRPPNQTSNDHELFLDTAQDILEKLNEYKKASLKLITGDLNFGNIYCKNIELRPKPLDLAAGDLFTSFGYKQLISIPTRLTENTLSLVDLIFIDNLDEVECHGTLPKIADHDGIIASFKFKTEKTKLKTKTLFDYKNADVIGLTKFIKEFNFDEVVFRQPIKDQPNVFSQVLTDAFSKFLPKKTITIRETDAPWCNNFTRLLLRKKNRNYLFYKKCDLDYRNALMDPNLSPELATKLFNKKDKAWEKSRQAANESVKANRRAKQDFFNNVNCTMRNMSISPKKKFNILFKLMKNQKFSVIPPLLENGQTIHDPMEKSNMLNSYFASKSTDSSPNDQVPPSTK